MTTIYLSSTYEDLKEYREVVYKALRQSGYDVIAMEDYVAADQRPVEKCLEDVAKADIYVGIFAFRYGYVPPESHKNRDGLSITELEFRQAESFKKPCLAFVVSETKSWPPMFDDARKGKDKGERINRLRQYLLTEKLGSSFSEPYELASLVQAAVTKHLHDSNPPSGTTGSEPLAVVAIWDIEKDGSPYPGLMHFTRKHARVFFGRDVELCEILDRMRQPPGRFIIISGDSGVGKSSVVDAGILPKLEDGSVPGGETCVTVRMVPGQANQPFAALMTALGAYAARAGLRPDAIIEDLKRSAESFTEQIRKIISGGTDGKQLVLFVDQMEELFTAQDVGESNMFLTHLFRAAQEKALWVIATIRSDHLHFCHRHPEMLGVLKGSGHYPLGPVAPYMMTDMIVKPAQCAGLTVSDAFAKRIVSDTLAFRSLENSESDTANLPLLAFVLDRLFQNRVDHSLSEEAYKAMGGVSGAIAEHVRAVEKELRQADGSKAGDRLATIFHSLVIVKEEGLPTRNRPLLSDFPAELDTSVNRLVNARLLRTEGEGDTATVSVSHEKLFEAWPALRDYISENKKGLMDQTLLQSRARKWADMGKPWFSGLASRRELKDFRQTAVSTPGTKTYLDASGRAWWIKSCGGLAAVLIFVVIAKAWQEGLSVDYTLLKGKSFFTKIHREPEMVVVEGREFKMGDFDNRGDRDARPVHDVQIKRFALGKYEVTFDEYDRFALVTGRGLSFDQGWGRGGHPVINVSWEDARDFAKWLSDETGKKYRLPSEAEWEYAARSGGKDQIWAGTSDEKQLAEYAVFEKSRTESTRGKRKANDLGLHDMSGNVWEWIEDCWHEDYTGAPKDGRAWDEGDRGQCGQRVLRGGSWINYPRNLRSSNRHRSGADTRNSYIGFRLAQDIN
jgi:formylglycine-generating enzyme required for sulfatase activity